jgi:hypothetical protein
MIFVRRKVRVTHLNVVEILERQRSLSALDRRRCDRGASFTCVQEKFTDRLADPVSGWV